MSASTFEACLKCFRSTDPSIRRESAEALATLDQSQAVNPLMEGLRDENPGVQEAAVAALIRIGGPRVVSSLVPQLREDVGTRNLALEVLEQTGCAGLDILLPLLSHDDANIRKFIVDTLGKRKTTARSLLSSRLCRIESRTCAALPPRRRCFVRQPSSVDKRATDGAVKPRV